MGIGSAHCYTWSLLTISPDESCNVLIPLHPGAGAQLDALEMLFLSLMERPADKQQTTKNKERRTKNKEQTTDNNSA
jgi:hypothetical protein